MNKLGKIAISRKEFLSRSLILTATPFLLGWDKVSPKSRYFAHGVASGDPLQDRVIIWTRVSDNRATDVVYWEMAEDEGFRKIIQKGTYQLSSENDYTVKIDVTKLKAASTYYYRFKYKNAFSDTGITQTLPETLQHGAFNIAVVSCSDYEAGYFNAYRFLAQKKDVNLVVHLGDYIYEYGKRTDEKYGRDGHGATIGRVVDPPHELLTLDDYRRRYALHREDPDMQLLHARKPFCMVWDDHEIVNDAYMDGSTKNHIPEKKGSWSARRSAAVQAYFEWLPIRGKAPEDLIKKITIGNDLELFLLDERLTGRTQQLSASDPNFYHKDRGILGAKQHEWLSNGLESSNAKWKLIANQVIFTGYRRTAGGRPSYKDNWLDYPYERNKLIKTIAESNIEGIVFLTGDHHRSVVLATHQEGKYMSYAKTCDARPLAWELFTPSITSKNDDFRPKKEIQEIEQVVFDKKINPHLLYADVKSQGYYIARITPDRFHADYFFVDNLKSRRAGETLAASFNMDAESFLLKRV